MSENEAVNTMTTVAPKVKGSRKPIPPMWRVLAKARKTFQMQLSKDNTIKLLCVTNFLNAEFHDVEKFWSDYFEQVAKLLNSRLYTAECDHLEVNPVNLAEHIVFLGSGTINKVLKDGIYRTIGGHTELYGERFSPADADKHRRNVAKTFGLENKLVGEPADTTIANMA